MCSFHPVRAHIVAAAVGWFCHRARTGAWAILALRRDRTAVTAIEYALMGSLVSLAIIGGVAGYSGSLGSMMNNTFTRIAAAM